MKEAEQHATPAGPLQLLRLLVLSMRPPQWTKNLLVYAAFFFTLNDHWTFDQPGEAGLLLARATAALLVFTAVSGATYLLNDLADLDRDRLHPRKRCRPLASGALPAPLGAGAAAILGIGGLAGAFALSTQLGIVALAYALLQAAYTLQLKHLVIIDVMALGAGFVLRAVAGAVAIDVPISPWLYACTALGSLFIGFGKRRNELDTLGGESMGTRSSLAQYTIPLLDQLTTIVATATLVAYTLYTVTAEGMPDNNAMLLTVPFVGYGLFRYLFLIHGRNVGESPEEILLTDRPLQATIVLWVASAVVVLLAFRA